MFSSKPYPLSTTWVEDLADTEQLKNAIRITSPEEANTVFTQTREEKMDWLRALDRAIAELATVADANGVIQMRSGLP